MYELKYINGKGYIISEPDYDMGYMKACREMREYIKEKYLSTLSYTDGEHILKDIYCKLFEKIRNI